MAVWAQFSLMRHVDSQIRALRQQHIAGQIDGSGRVRVHDAFGCELTEAAIVGDTITEAGAVATAVQYTVMAIAKSGRTVAIDRLAR